MDELCKSSRDVWGRCLYQVELIPPVVFGRAT